MDEQFDDNLKNHISKAFENLDYPTADEGWLALRKKFPVKEKERPVIWLWRIAAAAVLILGLGIGIWINYQNDNTVLIANKPTKNKLVKENPVNENNDLLINKKTTPNSATDTGVSLDRGFLHNKKPIGNTSIVKTQETPNPVTGQNEPVEIFIQQPVSDKDAATVTSAPHKTITSNAIAIIVTDSIKNKPEQIIARQQPGVLPELSKTNTYTLQANKTVVPATDNEQKVKFGVYAATYFNYAKGSENKVNMGLGFTSDIKISRKVKLSTGVAIAQNSLNYTNQPSSFSPSSAASIIPFNQSSITKSTYGAVNNYTFSSAAITPAIKNYNALLIGLDIPLNLKYEFDPQKSRSYIVVGLSSGTFINESYTYNYNTTTNYGNGVALTANQQQPLSQTTKNSFNDFYFAKTLNVSFGLGYPLGKNHLIIEPFLKYPLAGLGTQQIYFGAGGVNLKFDFQPSKK